jgi:uncharacterized protein (DUF2141 family)
MARFLALISTVFLLFSCGQIGSISGGPKDEVAPQIVQTNLSDKQLNFQGQQVQITFDEYIELVKPNEQIVLVPADTKLACKLSKKTLAISFENALIPNTTYTLYLNGAVKDVTEGNDSLMKFIFSTGKQMDSLRFHCSVYDAYSKEMLPKVTVGLYNQWEDAKPRYFAQSNGEGMVRFDALKAGDYYVKSFVDVNQDGQIQVNEKQGYRFESLHLDNTYQDTLNMAVSLPVQIDKVKNARVIPPGIIGLHLPADRSRDRIQLNGQIIDIDRLIGAGEDSVLIAIGSTKETDLSLVVEQDTLFVRYPLKQQAAKLGVQFIEKEGLQDRFFISCSDFIQFIDTTKIQLRNMEDSSLVSYSIDYLAHMIELTPKKGCRNLKLVVGEGAIVGLTQNKNAAFQKEIQWKLKREFGDLTMMFSDTIDAGMIQVIQKTEVIRTIEIQRSTKLLVPNLLPGEYTFKILLDRNKNGKWDPVSPETKTLAEEVLLYKAPVKIRANWEIESTFDVRKE